MSGPRPSFAELLGMASSVDIGQYLPNFHQAPVMKTKSGHVFVSRSHENESSKRKNSGSGEGEDMISNLPDVIIGHILSFLPTKDAVRTSVLSKRWICLWTIITKLSFGDEGLYSSRKKNKRHFISFVYRVLHHLKSSSIESFSLAISEKHKPCHANKWISAATDRKVKKVDVYSRKEMNYLSFDSLFKCKSLEELVWIMDCCVARVRVPSFGYCLSSLTVLKLSGIIFMCGHSNDSELILSLPVLRKYETKNCTWSNLKGVTLNVPLLEVVSIEYKPTLAFDSSYTTIKFCASQVKEFTYIGFMLPDILVLDLSAAHIASAKIVPYRYQEHSIEVMASLTCLFLEQLNANVECLQLQKSEVLAHAKDFVVRDLPTFEMLSHLELDIVTGEILLALLLKAPFLKTLVIKRIIQFDNELLNSASVPDCFLSTLQMVKFENFRGDENELNLAKFVMENTLVLERMSVFPTWMLFGLNLENVKEKLFSFRKSSRVATIEFRTV